MSCTSQGPCKGRTIPCLNCTRPGVEPWPAAEDTCTWGEWVTGPLLLAVPIGIVLGVAYGLLRDFFPAIFTS
ncbi:MAG: hypothetical protein V4706_01790 [Pseudomonadota bacterium]